MSILNSIKSPEDLKKTNTSKFNQLAKEIRERIISVTSKNGGHVASNLGVVELTMALHYVFNSPKDKIVWDVSHQTYTHKILTGRNDLLSTLRQDNGCIGFASQQESEHDIFGAGHAGTAISASLGIAAARDRVGSKEKVIAVVGDGALTCGISFEALNHVAEVTDDLIIVLNDNKMSISKNVGKITASLTNIIPTRGYNRIRNSFRNSLLRIPFFGQNLYNIVSKIKNAAKHILIPGILFEELGIRYIGPIDGHKVHDLIRTFELIKELDTPVVVHVVTEKGKGYPPAELHPEKFHGLGSFDPSSGTQLKKATPTYSSAFSDAIMSMAQKHDNIVAITAAMSAGTGLTAFRDKYPNRFFDVGIAEEHAAVFAAGMATNGLRPIVAIYSTFLQRTLGCVFHDICLQNLPVIICADRSGIVDDGPTHHGIYDVSYLRTLPNLAILYPTNHEEMDIMLDVAFQHKAPVIIRYPRGSTPSSEQYTTSNIEWGKAQIIKAGKKISIWATGKECITALEVAKILEKSKISAEVVNTMFLKPFDTQMLLTASKTKSIVTIEDNLIKGGLGSCIDEILINQKHKMIMHFGWNDEIVPHGTIAGLKKSAGLTADKIADKIKNHLL